MPYCTQGGRAAVRRSLPPVLAALLLVATVPLPAHAGTICYRVLPPYVGMADSCGDAGSLLQLQGVGDGWRFGVWLYGCWAKYFVDVDLVEQEGTIDNCAALA